MDSRNAVPILEAIIEQERELGCPMADENLIGPALRRWKSYERRNKQNKDKSLEHRTLDLQKGLLALYPDHNYDPGCIAHLAKSFAEVLFSEQFVGLTRSIHAREAPRTKEVADGKEQLHSE